MKLPWKVGPADAPWPVVLTDASVAPVITLRPLLTSDERLWHELRQVNARHVGPWEPTLPPGSRVVAPVTFRQLVRDFDTQARVGESLPWCIEVGGAIVGQVHIFGITAGASRSAAVGYWVAQTVARRGIASRAVALAIDYALGPGKLHRIEINIRVDNAASLGVAHRLGLRDEGVRERFLHIDGQWRDHRSFAMTTEELGPGGLIGRLSHP